MTVQELYENLHGDFQEACKRLLNEKMVANFVLKFPTDPSMQQLRDAVAASDIESSFRAIHTLKSVSGVLSLTQLYKVAWDLTEQLRPRLDQADQGLLELVEKEYALTVAAIKEFADSQ
ncbi:MAG: Hpt domain-containing protein [Bacteroidia bacterium]|nr:Hpt domain-containing protein [Bacteroidia bacterium]